MTVNKARMGLARVLKPPRNFEAVYDGLNAGEVPIAIPGTLDFRAGEQGFDPGLLAGISIPLGSRLLLYLPMSFAEVGEGFPGAPYTYRILWRLRSTGDTAAVQNKGLNHLNPQYGLFGHLAQEYKGIPNDDGADPSDLSQERLVIPAALTSVLFQQTEPGNVSADSASNLRGERISVRGESWGPAPQGAPILVEDPPNPGIAGQGIAPFLTQNNARFGGPMYLPYETDSFGDEYIILVNRGVGATNWDFAGQDFAFSRLFGTANGTREPLPGVGIYAMTGAGAS